MGKGSVNRVRISRYHETTLGDYGGNGILGYGLSPLGGFAAFSILRYVNSSSNVQVGKTLSWKLGRSLRRYAICLTTHLHSSISLVSGAHDLNVAVSISSSLVRRGASMPRSCDRVLVAQWHNGRSKFVRACHLHEHGFPNNTVGNMGFSSRQKWTSRA